MQSNTNNIERPIITSETENPKRKKSAASRHVFPSGRGDQIIGAEAGSSSGGDKNLTPPGKKDKSARDAEINISSDNAVPPEYAAIYTANRDHDIINSYRAKYKKLTEDLIRTSDDIEPAEMMQILMTYNTENLKTQWGNKKAEINQNYNSLLEARYALVKGLTDALDRISNSNQI